MTALCGGGASAAQPGYGTLVSVGIASIAATLNNVPTPLAMAAAGYIGALGYELSTFCTTDPPAMPTITAGDWAALLTVSDPVAHLAAVSKFEDLFGNVFWPTFCECTSTTTPAPPALPSPPTGLPTVNPTSLPTAPQSGHCWDKVANSTFSLIPSTYTDISSAFINTGTPKAVTAPSGYSGANVAYPTPNALNGGYTYSMKAAAVGGYVTNASMIFWDSTGVMTSVTSLYATHDVLISHAESGVSPGGYWAIYAAGGQTGVPTPTTITGELWFDCTGSPSGSVQTPCCPPDPSLQALLENLTALVTSIYQSLPTPLSSYASGTVHAGLSGNGTVTLATQALAVRVDITTDAPALGAAAGDPVYLYDRGYIVPVINSAPVRQLTRVAYNPQMFLLPALTEQVGYSFAPGVVATITELTAGP